MRHVRVLLAALSGLVLLAGCGPVGTTPPPQLPDDGQAAPQWVTFWARAYAIDGSEVYTQQVAYVVAAFDAQLRPVVFSDGQVEIDVNATTTPAYFAFQPDPQVDQMTFTVSGAVSRGYTLTCEVRAGDQHNPDAPLISANSALSKPLGVTPLDYLNVTCAYPEL